MKNLINWFEIRIGLRYTKAKRKNGFISFISMISMFGITLGVMALIIVISVMNGFQTELRTRILGVASHIQITGEDNTLSKWQNVKSTIENNNFLKNNVLGVSPYVMAQSMISFDDMVKGSIIRGIIPDLESQVSDFKKIIKIGNPNNLKAGTFGIILGKDLARNLGVRVGEKVVLIAPQGQVTVAGMIPRLKQFTVVAIFDAGMYEFDANLAFIHLQDAQTLFKLNIENQQVSGLRLKLKELYDAPKISQDLMQILSKDFYISDWTQQHQNFFKAIQLEKTVMFIILTLIIAVASFNIVSTLVMLVTDKRADIAILRTLGAKPKSIMWIFLIQGCLIGTIGTILGVSGGVLVSLNIDNIVKGLESLVGTHFLSKEIYYLSELPSELQFKDVGLITILSFGMSILATIYPSWKASKIEISEALRYE